MKLKYWMVVYPFHMAGGDMKPCPSVSPVEPGPGTKLVSFTVEVPDDLFGEIEVSATVDRTGVAK